MGPFAPAQPKSWQLVLTLSHLRHLAYIGRAVKFETSCGQLSQSFDWRAMHQSIMGIFCCKGSKHANWTEASMGLQVCIWAWLASSSSLLILNPSQKSITTCCCFFLLVKNRLDMKTDVNQNFSKLFCSHIKCRKPETTCKCFQIRDSSCGLSY